MNFRRVSIFMGDLGILVLWGDLKLWGDVEKTGDLNRWMISCYKGINEWLREERDGLKGVTKI